MLRSFFLILTFLCSLRTYADEGMWIPLLLDALESDMQAMGMKMSAEDIYSVNQGSLKDAIVHFGGFCTGEVISSQGLVLTNHHCGYSAIQSHSTLENNLLKNGYWATSQQEELPNPGLFVTFIVRIEDVTSAVLDGCTDALSPEAQQSLVDRNISALREQISRESYQDIVVRPFYEGNQYFAFVTETYRDVRLVGAPPEAIGKFGADTDNWEWPRHTGDFSMFRIYASPDNTPAEYAPENVPYTPKHALPVSTSGVKEGDFTLVFGFPGRTDQYLTSYAVQQTIDIIDPARTGIRGISLKIMNEAMRRDEATRLQLAPRYAGLANSWKKWIGERQGLIRTNAVAVKQQNEEEFRKRLEKDPSLKSAYGDLLPAFAALYASTDSLEQVRIFYNEIFGTNVRIFQLISRFERLRRIYENNGEQAFLEEVQKQRDWFADFFHTVDFDVDQKTAAALFEHLGHSLPQMYLPTELKRITLDAAHSTYAEYGASLFTDEVTTPMLLDRIGEMDGAQFSEAVAATPAYQIYRAILAISDSLIAVPYGTALTEINKLQRRWMEGLMVVFPEKRFFPDANSTMRVSYGQVEGYHPRDGIFYEPVTYLEGVMEKYQPGDYEFDVPERLLRLYHDKDYGPYADPGNGKMPVCFLGSNHTTGGNSGSPAIDAEGNLIGINFDRVWEGTMSDLYYNREICRNIMVDIRYILFIIDKYGGAKRLIDEMELVHP